MCIRFDFLSGLDLLCDRLAIQDLNGICCVEFLRNNFRMQISSGSSSVMGVSYLVKKKN
ncbi:hypothetical protein K435DRAFT_203408 [Dendrothele bispora CBS 962.96]|uniref:Uncharacterized protein n=1 Tax=Dendrothele bispora (strain CBS 962.96) TaxID=1314807 RepID=A0A4V4HEX1_DENBC|nr:hypothetical protein K435DRAFT_203408 [Dendrothele bispora CBS 962.96]